VNKPNSNAISEYSRTEPNRTQIVRPAQLESEPTVRQYEVTDQTKLHGYDSEVLKAVYRAGSRTSIDIHTKSGKSVM